MATEQIILKKDVRKLGDRGDVVRVAAGYARNYLFPQSLAMPATAANKRQIEEMRAAAGRESARLREDASKLAETMHDVTVRIVSRAGDSGQLFGSVTTRDVAVALEKKGFPIDRHDILLERPLKQTGDYEVRIHLYKDVKQTIKVEIRAEGREDELFGEAKAKAEAEAAAVAAAEAAEAAQVKADEAAAKAARDAAAGVAAPEILVDAEIEALEEAAEEKE
jgi:large subunit ribosomal protein L9